ncbi:MAG TPA: caspase family protein [Longimicrobium sp.]|nr:caspase family protein [Longimicrobium sp.]
MAKGIAVIAAVTEFPARISLDLPELKLPEKNAQRFAGLIQSARYGYQVAQPLLLGSMATIGAWKKAVKDAVAGLQQDDVLLLFFSGHGYQASEVDLCPDGGTNEYWCFFTEKLLDNEIGAVLESIPSGLRVFVVADCCYATGTYWIFRYGMERKLVEVDSMLDAKLRKVTRDVRGTVAQASAFENQDDEAKCPRPSARILFMAACDEREQGKDGLFMESLLHVMETEPPTTTFETAFKRVCDLVSRENSTQTPRRFRLGQKNPSLLDAPAFKI